VLARPAVLPGLREREAEIVVRLQMSGRQLDRGLELTNRPGELVGLEVHEAEVDPERRVGAVLAHQSLVHLGGAAEIA
jgi:hypothetical protein